MPDKNEGFAPEPEPDGLKIPALDGIIICGLPKGEHHAHKCPCCGMESDNPELFAITICWECVTGNLDCETCIRSGIGIARFSTSRGRVHRFSTWDPPKVAGLTTCGIHIEYADMGAAGDLKPCRRCWPATPMEAAA